MILTGEDEDGRSWTFEIADPDWADLADGKRLATRVLALEPALDLFPSEEALDDHP